MEEKKPMKKNPERSDEQEREILKAVAQAWHGHSGNSRPINEFDAYRRNFKIKPTRFKLEAMNKLPKASSVSDWDFGQSLWDSYEIVNLSKKLEAALVLDHPMLASEDSNRVFRNRRKESRTSLRNLFSRMSSRRFDAADIPGHDHP